MKCPKCKGKMSITQTIDDVDNVTYREYGCKKCVDKFATMELLLGSPCVIRQIRIAQKQAAEKAAL